MKRLTPPLLTLLFAIICSCTIEKEISEDLPQESNSNPTLIQTRSSKESESAKSKLLSDKDIIMLQHLIVEKGKIKIALTEEEAGALGIDSEIYRYYKKLVNQLNANDNE